MAAVVAIRVGGGAIVSVGVAFEIGEAVFKYQLKRSRQPQCRSLKCMSWSTNAGVAKWLYLPLKASFLTLSIAFIQNLGSLRQLENDGV